MARNTGAGGLTLLARIALVAAAYYVGGDEAMYQARKGGKNACRFAG